MDSDSDDFDYLSLLKSGFSTEKIPKISSASFVSFGDNSSDTYGSDSDDCVIVKYIDPKKNKSKDKSVDNQREDPPKTNPQNDSICPQMGPNASTSTVAKDVCIESNSKSDKSLESQGLDQKLDSFVDNIKHLKEDFESKPETSFKSDNEIDVKPDIKPSLRAPDWDIKPLVLKIENGVKKEESLPPLPNNSSDIESASDCMKSDNKSIEGQDLSPNDNKRSFEESALEQEAGNRMSLVMAILDKIRFDHQKPTFDRILVKYNKMSKNTISDSKSTLMSLLREAMDRNVIEKVVGIDGKDDSYRLISTGNKKSPKSSKSSQISVSDSDLTIDEMSVDSNSSPESNRNSNNSQTMDPNIESLALDEDFTDINDIDVSSAQQLFGDTELDPEVFEIYQVATNESPKSLSFNSTPIKSFNHNRNKEVIRKQLVSPSSTSSDKIDQMLSLKDYRNWLLEPLPRFSPFIAQRGDRVVYLRDAHQIYIEYELKELIGLYSQFETTPKLIEDALQCEDYVINAVITNVNFYQINYIKFSVIRLESLSNEKPFKFNVLYRPNRGICDFLVLDYLYRESQKHVWSAGKEFRSLWKKSWWIGKIVERKAFNIDNYPNSLFKCYVIEWNTGERGALSPWDLFPVDPNRLPKRIGNGVLITAEDMWKINYIPRFNEWPEVYNHEVSKWRCYECKRNYNAIKFMERNVFQHIVDAFNLSNNSEITYPVSLKLIKERLKNFFYRRKESIIFDISYLKTNSKLYIKKNNQKFCEDFVDLLLGVANDTNSITNDHFVTHLNKYPHLIQNTPHSVPQCLPVLNSEVTNPVITFTPSSSSTPMPNILNQCTTGRKSSNKGSRKRSAPSTLDSSLSSVQSEVKVTQSTQWKEDSQKFIDDFLKIDDSVPYRQPVDTNLFPNYHNVIKEPIDLSEIQRKLSLDEYPNPQLMRKDFRLMFENARVFTKDPKSKMRQINKNLSHLAEDRLREIIVDWERVYHYEQKKRRTNGYKVREPISRNQLWGYSKEQYY